MGGKYRASKKKTRFKEFTQKYESSKRKFEEKEREKNNKNNLSI